MGNKKIKVCFFSPASYHFFIKADNSDFGGAELQMYLLANQLAENPIFEILFLVGNYKQKCKIKKGNIKLIKSINMLSDETFISKLFKSIRYIFLLIKLNPDVIITTTFNPIAGVTSFYKKTFKKKHIHRSASNADTDTSRIKENGFSGKMFKYGLEHADVILCQNGEQQKLLKKNHNKETIKLKNVFEIKSRKSTNKNYVLWVGRYINLKKPELFLDLAKQNKDNMFIMICSYHQKDFKGWNKLKQQAEQIPNLTFIEKVPFVDIQNYFNESKLFVNTSDFEGFPNTFLQAAQGKTPIVSLNVNPDNFITKYNCGIYCKNDFKIMVEETKQLLKNEAELKLKGENCFQYLKNNHEINNIGKQLEQIIIGLT